MQKKIEELIAAVLATVPLADLTEEIGRRFRDRRVEREDLAPVPDETTADSPVAPTPLRIAPKVTRPDPVAVRSRNPILYVVGVILDARESHGLSVREIAEIAEVSPETVYRYAQKKRTVRGGAKRASMALKIVEAVVAFTGYGRRSA